MVKGKILKQDDLVLVTGGAGYVGSHLVRLLLSRGYRVRILDAFLYGDRGIRDCAADPRLEIVRGDICNARDMIRAVKGARAVIALAALVGDGACDLDRDETTAINIESSRLLASVVCATPGVDRVVFASSCSVYGATDGLILNEGSRLNPVSFYARTRIASERILAEALGDRSLVTLRLGTVFGASPRMRLDLMINTMTHRAFRDRKITVMGGQAWRPHVHCRDVAAAFALAAEASHDLVRGEVFNVGSDANNFTISEVAVMVAAEVPGTEIEYADTVEDLRSYRVSFEKIRHVLGYSTRYRVEDGIREVLAMLERGDVDGDDERTSNLRYLQLHGFGGEPPIASEQTAESSAAS